MKKALAKLPVADREIITQLYIDGKSINEIATQLGITSAYARVRIHRILQHIRRSMSTVRVESERQ